MDTMSSTVQGVFFLVAVVLFVAAALLVKSPRVNLVALGLAFFVFVFMWNAFAE